MFRSQAKVQQTVYNFFIQRLRDLADSSVKRKWYLQEMLVQTASRYALDYLLILLLLSSCDILSRLRLLLE